MQTHNAKIDKVDKHLTAPLSLFKIAKHKGLVELIKHTTFLILNRNFLDIDGPALDKLTDVIMLEHDTFYS